MKILIPRLTFSGMVQLILASIRVSTVPTFLVMSMIFGFSLRPIWATRESENQNKHCEKRVCVKSITVSMKGITIQRSWKLEQLHAICCKTELRRSLMQLLPNAVVLLCNKTMHNLKKTEESRNFLASASHKAYSNKVHWIVNMKDSRGKQLNWYYWQNHLIISTT